MKRLAWSGGVLSLLLLIGVFWVRPYVQVSDNFVWLSKPGFTAKWEIDTKASIWSELGADRTEKLIVYLTPDLRMSVLSLGKKDQPAVYYANWGEWEGREVLYISINWDEWRRIDKGERDKYLSMFIVARMVDQFKVADSVSNSFTSNMLHDKSEPPVRVVE